MSEESSTPDGTAVDPSADTSTGRLMRETAWLALILIAAATVDTLGRRDLLPGGGYLSSLLLLILGLVFWARFHIRLPWEVSRIRGALLTCLFLGALAAAFALAFVFPRDGVAGGPTLRQMLHLIVLVPLAEELYFRGLLFDHLRRGFGPVLAVILCSLLFGLLHYPTGGGHQAFLLSGFACLLVLKGGSIVYAVQLHVTWNAMSQMDRLADVDLRLICFASAAVFVCGLAVAARRGTLERDSVARTT